MADAASGSQLASDRKEVGAYYFELLADSAKFEETHKKSAVQVDPTKITMSLSTEDLVKLADKTPGNYAERSMTAVVTGGTSGWDDDKNTYYGRYTLKQSEAAGAGLNIRSDETGYTAPETDKGLFELTLDFTKDSNGWHASIASSKALFVNPEGFKAESDYIGKTWTTASVSGNYVIFVKHKIASKNGSCYDETTTYRYVVR